MIYKSIENAKFLLQIHNISLIQEFNLRIDFLFVLESRPKSLSLYDFWEK